MSGDYNLYPFMQLPDCQLHEQVQDLTCEDAYKKIISLRVYFAIVILNFIFVVSTTVYFIYRLLTANWSIPPSDMLSVTNETISKRWRLYSLRKREIFGSVLGAIGHLIFSTTVFLYQVFVNSFSCDIFLWGPMVGFLIWTYALVWRAYRLHLLIRVNELQERYNTRNAASYDSCGEKVVGTKSTAASISNGDKDYTWFMRHKGALNLSTKYQIVISSFFLIFITCIITLAEALGIWSDGRSSCKIYMGNYMVSALVAFFFLVIVPFIFWFLRNDDDAHGMRKEIWITVAVGIPCSVLCVVWQIAFDYPTSKNPAGIRGVFGPCNWLVILTTTNHIASTIMPVFKTLTIDDNKSSVYSGHKRRREKCKLLPFKNKQILKKLFLFKNWQRKQSTLEESNENNVYEWELTVESLYHALSNPKQIAILKNWAVKDFSVENILFYDRYLNLVKQLYQSQVVDTNKPSSPLAEPTNVNSDLRTSMYSNDSDTPSKPSEELLNIPFNFDQIPQLVDIYNTFIIDQAPLQVNVSYKAKSTVEKIMGSLAKEYRNTLARPPGPSMQSSIPYFSQTAEPCDTFDQQPYSAFKTKSCEGLITSTTISTSRVTSENEALTLRVFEQVRKEVFWNIFSGIFPKVVEAYNMNHAV